MEDLTSTYEAVWPSEAQPEDIGWPSDPDPRPRTYDPAELDHLTEAWGHWLERDN